ncbi:unnamed protein product [Anisakis simplex]|uniref:Uncharacterized protein n=1 Tax=Anisakis simplex TaxID=6269 RepID=A0A0M3JNU5_ANISI|nr:unnamed protein product [Anisakis simplex]
MAVRIRPSKVPSSQLITSNWSIINNVHVITVLSLRYQSVQCSR